MEKKAYRGTVFSFKPHVVLEEVPQKKHTGSDTYQFIEDGVVVVSDGVIESVEDYTTYKEKYFDIDLIHYPGKIITPGFIDTHIHATQTAVMASYGERLIEWLDTYVFPAEKAFEHEEKARAEATFFLDSLLSSGTTTACAYGSSFFTGCDALLDEASHRNMRLIAGNTMMDQDSGPLHFSSQENHDIAIALIEKWHNKKRLQYCVTPRFALSCSEPLLELCGALMQQYPGVYLQTHLNENHDEISAVKNKFPWSSHYLGVYEKFGLLTDRSIFGHCLHLTQAEYELMQHASSIISWCPTSNNFLGSGLFDYEKMRQYTTNITLATDCGAGSSFSMCRVLDDAYKVAMLQGQRLPSLVRWYMATLGAARALKMDNLIGSLSPGKEADFIVLDPEATPLLKYRSQQVDNIFDLLFLLMTIGDERLIYATYLAGECAFLAKT